ncbi:hypothetical protein A5724_13545 [Mycobacterium sp. ACS1612]|uniref:hypothetical protein n=1 Tax=Mycobacterium sp. ACS1612 TaxID=1834117 RepID=UPI0007FE311E|nr:hypothetical protein [Mycobacterium sp. ACS1612]OBF36221.1 hypothetical protein A5724_13545 [Mycobacterium sp. ACS1612]
MRTRLMLGVVGVCGAVVAPAGVAYAEETAQEVINRLQSEGYTVNIDKIGTGSMDQCVVTNVRNPQQVKQWLPYSGPGRDGDRVLVQVVTSQSISVTLNCSQ